MGLVGYLFCFLFECVEFVVKGGEGKEGLLVRLDKLEFLFI